MVIFLVLIVFITLEKKANLNHAKKFLKIKLFAIFVMPPQETKTLEFNQYPKI